MRWRAEAHGGCGVNWGVVMIVSMILARKGWFLQCKIKGSWVDVSPWLTRVMNCDEKVVEIGFIVNRKRLKLAAQTTLLAPSVLPEHP